MEPRHGPIRSIYIRLRHAQQKTTNDIHALRAVRVSNDLYGSDVLSAYEADKGYTRPVNPEIPPVPVDEELLEAHANLIARRKLMRILRSHSLSTQDFRVGDLAQIFSKRGKEKRGRWLSPRQVISINTESGMLSVPGAAGHQINVAFEYARAAQMTRDIKEMVQQAIDQFDENIDNLLMSADGDHDSIISPDRVPHHATSNDTPSVVDIDDSDVSAPELDNNGDSSPLTLQSEAAPQSDPEPVVDAHPPESVVADSNNSPDIGDHIEVFWPADNAYYPGIVAEIQDDGRHVILYDDADVEIINLANEQWRYANTALAHVGRFVTLPSNEQRVLAELMKTFGNKPFMFHHAQGFEQSPLVKAYIS